MNIGFCDLKNSARHGRLAAVSLLFLLAGSLASIASVASAQDAAPPAVSPTTSSSPSANSPLQFQTQTPIATSTSASTPASAPMPVQATLPSRERTNRLEELFIWKISEELDLSAAEEHDVIAMIKSLDQDKANASTVIDNIQDQMSTAKDPQKVKALLKDYRKALLNYNNLSVAELDRVQKLLKPERAAKYFVVKANLSQRIRTILGSATRPGEHFRGFGADATRDAAHDGQHQHVGTLPDPKIIEE